MADIVRVLRRHLRRGKHYARRVAARRRGPAALLDAPGVRPADLRWAGRRSAADPAIATRALLALVARHGGTEPEQRRARLVGQPRPTPATSRPAPARPATDQVGAATDTPVLDLRRSGATGPVDAVLTAAGRPELRLEAVWRPAWAQLPAALADQLAVGALTRIGRVHGVRAVGVDDAAAVLGAAVAAGLGCPLQALGSGRAGHPDDGDGATA